MCRLRLLTSYSEAIEMAHGSILNYIRPFLPFEDLRPCPELELGHAGSACLRGATWGQQRHVITKDRFRYRYVIWLNRKLPTPGRNLLVDGGSFLQVVQFSVSISRI